MPLWRGDHVSVRQLVEDFAQYLYLPRISEAPVLLTAIEGGVAGLTWEQDAFAFADSYDEPAGRYRGLCGGRVVALPDADAPGLLVKPEVARRQLDAEGAAPSAEDAAAAGDTAAAGAAARGGAKPGAQPAEAPRPAPPKRFHGAVELDPACVGRDAAQIADEVISHLAGLVGARLKATLEIEADIPSGAPDQVVRTVTENGRTLKFTSQGFEKE